MSTNIKSLIDDVFTFNPFCKSQMSIHTTAISDLKDTLIICSFKVRIILSNKSVSLRTASIMSELIGSFVLSAI